MPRVGLKSQSLTEMAIVAAVLAAVILSMRIYMQRSLQARYKAGPDYLISEIKNAAAEKGISNFSGMKKQYDPYYRESNILEDKKSAASIGTPETSTGQTVIRSGWEKAKPAQEAD
ncbi:MAG: hypothetical protein WC359_15565 [Dehalococcoidia bacterium]|jgi:hypothetical protein